jgi:HK97 family phage prohead protease
LGLPPAFLQDLSSGTFSNTEQQDLQLVKHLIAHWAKAFEDELNLKLFGQRRRAQYAEHNLDGIMRGDFKSRSKALARAIQTAQLTPNEARALENRRRSPAATSSTSRARPCRSRWPASPRARSGQVRANRQWKRRQCRCRHQRLTAARRARSRPLELRAAAADGAARPQRGYAALFNVETDIGGYWTEEIAPGAFTRSLRENDVVALHSHDTGRVIGRTGAKTLTLREDDKGLAFENELPGTTDGNDLAVSIERGDIPGMSFGFITRKQEWDETVDPPKRTILEADLYEITYTAFPQYPDTEIGLRSLEQARERAPPAQQDRALARSRKARTPGAASAASSFRRRAGGGAPLPAPNPSARHRRAFSCPRSKK